MTLKSTIPALRAALQPAANRGVHRAAGYVLDLARQLCPIDEGDLRASGRLDPDQPAERVEVKFGGVRGPNKFVDYAVHVEFGTVNSPAQPFLTPAARAIKPEIEVKDEIIGAIRSNTL